MSCRAVKTWSGRERVAYRTVAEMPYRTEERLASKEGGNRSSTANSKSGSRRSKGCQWKVDVVPGGIVIGVSMRLCVLSRKTNFVLWCRVETESESNAQEDKVRDVNSSPKNRMETATMERSSEA